MHPTRTCSPLHDLPRPTHPPPTHPCKQALDAHRSLFAGQILMGVEVPPEAWGGHVITVAECQDLAAYVRSAGGDGMMIWSLQVREGRAGGRRSEWVVVVVVGGAPTVGLLAQQLADACTACVMILLMPACPISFPTLQKAGIPSAQTLSSTICNTLGLGGCTTPLWP